MTIPASAADGLVTKPSVNSVDATLDRLEAALKERGFSILTRLIVRPRLRLRSEDTAIDGAGVRTTFWEAQSPTRTSTTSPS